LKAESHISETILSAVKSHYIREARNGRRSKSLLWIVRYIFGSSLCIIPAFFFSFEIIPERCKICLDNAELNTCFVTSGLCGGFGATLLSHDISEYFCAKFLGGGVGSLGALITIRIILQAIPSSNAFSVAFLFVGILGAMPGSVVYFLVKNVAEEIKTSDPQYFEDDFASLTKLIMVEG